MNFRVFCSKSVALILISILICFQSISVCAAVGSFGDLSFVRSLSDQYREIISHGGGEYTISFSTEGLDDDYLFELVDDESRVHKSLSYIKLSKKDDNGSFDAIKGFFPVDREYRSYVVRVDNGVENTVKGKIIFEDRTPEFEARLENSSEEDKKVLVLKNIFGKPITVTRIQEEEYNGEKLEFLDLTEDKKIFPGDTYEIELQPGSCFGNEKTSHELSVDFSYLVEGDILETDSIIEMTFLCEENGVSIGSIFNTVIDMFSSGQDYILNNLGVSALMFGGTVAAVLVFNRVSKGSNSGSNVVAGGACWGSLENDLKECQQDELVVLAK